MLYRKTLDCKLTAIEEQENDKKSVSDVTESRDLERDLARLEHSNDTEK